MANFWLFHKISPNLHIRTERGEVGNLDSALLNPTVLEAEGGNEILPQNGERACLEKARDGGLICLNRTKADHESTKAQEAPKAQKARVKARTKARNQSTHRKTESTEIGWRYGREISVGSYAG